MDWYRALAQYGILGVGMAALSYFFLKFVWPQLIKNWQNTQQLLEDQVKQAELERRRAEQERVRAREERQHARVENARQITEFMKALERRDEFNERMLVAVNALGRRLEGR